MQWKLATLERKGPDGATSLLFKLDGGWAAVIAAILAIIPTLLTEALLKPLAQQPSIAIEQGKLALEDRKAMTALLQAALADPEPERRHRLLQFLSTAGIVQNPTLMSLPADQLPNWPSFSARAP